MTTMVTRARTRMYTMQEDSEIRCEFERLWFQHGATKEAETWAKEIVTYSHPEWVRRHEGHPTPASILFGQKIQRLLAFHRVGPYHPESYAAKRARKKP